MKFQIKENRNVNVNLVFFVLICNLFILNTNSEVSNKGKQKCCQCFLAHFMGTISLPCGERGLATLSTICYISY